MQTAISWSNYITGVIIVTVCYYLVIGYKYYLQDIKDLLSGKRKPRKVSAGRQAREPEPVAEPEPVMEGLFDELEELVYDVKTSILEKAGEAISKEELLELLKGRLAQYEGLRKPAIRMAINHFIIQHALETCQIDFSEQELNTAWDSLGSKE